MQRETKQTYTIHRRAIAKLFIAGALPIGMVSASTPFLKQHIAINTSASMPLGIYKLTPNTPERGVIVGACIPNSFSVVAASRGYVGQGSCSDGLRPVMKYVAGVSGDSVEVTLAGVSVNGESLQNTAVLLHDGEGRAISNQIGTHVIPPNHYWLTSNHSAGCFDSRYFGSVSEIRGVVTPLLTKTTLCRFKFFQLTMQCQGEQE